MELQGKIFRILPLQSGEGKNGTWKKQEFILETEGQYAKKVCLSLWGDKIDASPLTEGTKVIASFDLESREYNGRWFTEAKAWKVVKQEEGSGAPASSQEPNAQDLSDFFDDNKEILPF